MRKPWMNRIALSMSMHLLLATHSKYNIFMFVLCINGAHINVHMQIHAWSIHTINLHHFHVIRTTHKILMAHAKITMKIISVGVWKRLLEFRIYLLVCIYMLCTARPYLFHFQINCKLLSHSLEFIHISYFDDSMSIRSQWDAWSSNETEIQSFNAIEMRWGFSHAFDRKTQWFTYNHILYFFRFWIVMPISVKLNNNNEYCNKMQQNEKLHIYPRPDSSMLIGIRIM